MYTILKTSGTKKLVTTEAPALFAALVLSELLYKFGSFTVECLAFLSTWFVISFLVNTFVLHRYAKAKNINPD